MALEDVVKRYRAHNDAIERKQAERPAPAGKACSETDCSNNAFPWDARCVSCERRHRRALRVANVHFARGAR
jgi:hypothetical protein